MAEEFVMGEAFDGVELAEGGGVAAGAGAAGVVEGAGVAAGADAGQRGRGAMRWTSVMSSFVLRRMCQLISTGVRTDKGFKEVHLNQVAKALQEFTGNEVTGTQVYNHLRKWRMRWVKVSKLRELSGAHWDDLTFTILLEDEHYKGHIKAHPKDAEFLNKPIENYQKMMVIFGSGMATGKFAMASNEPLGTPSDFADSSLKVEGIVDEKPPKANDNANLFGEAPKNHDAGSCSGVGHKRKRATLTEEDTTVLSNMTAAVNNVAEAIRETIPDEVHPELYNAVMLTPRFTEEALIVAFSHLVDNKAQGIGFVGMTDAHRVLWLRNFLAKHYYM
ncbi:hypothetical protein ACP70R_037195 [Stipagrostis hirtigluma subsp. patula]